MPLRDVTPPNFTEKTFINTSKFTKELYDQLSAHVLVVVVHFGTLSLYYIAL